MAYSHNSWLLIGSKDIYHFWALIWALTRWIQHIGQDIKYKIAIVQSFGIYFIFSQISGKNFGLIIAAVEENSYYDIMWISQGLIWQLRIMLVPMIYSSPKTKMGSTVFIGMAIKNIVFRSFASLKASFHLIPKFPALVY